MARTLPHLFLLPPDVSTYTSPSSGGNNPKRPARNRHAHFTHLRSNLDEAWRNSTSDEVVALSSRDGVYLEFKGENGYELATKSLEDLRAHVRLCNVRQHEGTTYATVFVPAAKKDFYFKKLQDYSEKNTPKGNPRNAALFETIANIEQALRIEAFWVGKKEHIPHEQSEWCEVWLRTDDKEKAEIFCKLLEKKHIEKKTELLFFPERTILLINVTGSQLLELIKNSDEIAEFRKAQTTAEFWTSLNPTEQAEWARELRNRTVVEDNNIRISILDTGVSNGHILLEPVLPANCCLATDDDWGTHDHHGHGTKMAGIAAYGSLSHALTHNDPVQLYHSLESVKLLPPDTPNPYELWGEITSRAISKAEIADAEPNRIFCMAVTAEDSPEICTPSSWSGALDQTISGAQDDEQRLFIVCAGNTALQTPFRHPENALGNSVHNPAQAWNALTVGAFTELVNITDPALANYSPAANSGGLSPYSSTSLSWGKKWPIKPEILMEGGNAAVENGFPTYCNDLSELTTYHLPHEQNFVRFEMTSLATAKASHFAAQIQAQNNDYWPETIRALMIHSANWTSEMLREFLPNTNKSSYEALLRTCGYGVPNLDHALHSANNSISLIAQETIQPYHTVRERKYKGFTTKQRTKDFHLYNLPWPKEILQDLPPETDVSMRITLSYFIEPGPGEIGWKDRYRYPSHGLRFKLKAPGETHDNFMQRINAAARNEEEQHDPHSMSDHWLIGQQGRDKGSIHSDTWKGTAAQLADSDLLAVHPTVGWWRERKHLGKVDKTTRYSLIVTIEAPKVEIDLYTPIATAVSIPIEIETSSRKKNQNGQLSLF